MPAREVRSSLREDVADVVLDGALRERQAGGYRGVAQAFGDEGRDLGLPAA